MEKVKVIPEALCFLKPVNKKSVKNYYDVIKRPMDLESMEKRINGKLTFEFIQFPGRDFGRK